MKKRVKPSSHLIEMLDEECNRTANYCPNYSYKIIVNAVLDLILFRLRFILFLNSFLIGLFLVFLITR